MTLFFTFFCFFGKHTWVSMGLAGCSVGREKEGCVIGVGFKYPQKGQRSPHFQKVMNYVTPPAGPGGWSKARRWREGRLWSQMLPPRRSLEWFPWNPAPEACPESPHLAIPFGTLSSLSWPVLCLSAPSEAASSSSSSPSYPFTLLAGAVSARPFSRPQEFSAIPSLSPRLAGGAEEGASSPATNPHPTRWL